MEKAPAMEIFGWYAIGPGPIVHSAGSCSQWQICQERLRRWLDSRAQSARRRRGSKSFASFETRRTPTRQWRPPRKRYKRTMEKMVTRLSWQDFEQLIDL